MIKPINILETGKYVEPYTFSTEAEAILFHSYIEQIEFTEAILKERDLLIEALKIFIDNTGYLDIWCNDSGWDKINKAKELLNTIKK